jgi:hypothetical protein
VTFMNGNSLDFVCLVSRVRLIRMDYRRIGLVLFVVLLSGCDVTKLAAQFNLPNNFFASTTRQSSGGPGSWTEGPGGPGNFSQGTTLLNWRKRLEGNDQAFWETELGDSVLVPEPMLFDLVRPLGAKKGELEINSLGVFPWRAVNRDLSQDPFGSGQTTLDRQGIEWAPEIEFAFADGWAVEFELPFESSKLEAYKVALQGTFGTAFDGHYIHGFQWIVEPTPQWQRWNSTLLYLGGIRFDEKWSALVMLGGRMNLAGRNNAQTFERLVNASLFYEVNPALTLGTEVNHAVGNGGRFQTILVPQLQYEFSPRFEVQSGVGLGVFDQGSEQSFIVRAILIRD